MLPTKFLNRRCVAVCAAAGLMVAAMAPAQAVLTADSAGPVPGERRMLLVQAPGAAPNVEANIAQLHQRLGITPEQEPQFAALANVMRENASAMSAPPPANANAVEGLRLAIHYGQLEIDGMRRLLPALQALYASLTPAQQQAADMIFRQGPGQ